MATQRPGAVLLLVAAACCGVWVLPSSFVAPGAPRVEAQQGQGQGLAQLAAAGAVAALPEAANARLPDEFVAFAPIVDVLPILPVFFLLLAFLWQASVGFR
eukprot:CAMPEP_0170619456 /NCGR_PEP_ID=MMETSP0224-20130122/27525_1 /TAXON_ID=285029 /ORGANISM="Togula jolla, Strain CCCM 725" /LENGTH=100 /DNA_ID=CAMNT_0010945545 /DNA_START=89 /DNA_END=391 /DNA_ORIENTATION=+